MVLTLSQIPFNENNKSHMTMIETMKNHMAINLPMSTLNLIKIHFKEIDDIKSAAKEQMLIIEDKNE